MTLGADVVKVESPSGDMIRTIGPQGQRKVGPLFLAMDCTKRSIALDLKSADGRAARLDQVRDADVLTDNVRPQAMARLGLDYGTLAAINPRLIYAGMFGFSQRGRYAASAAFDDLIQAACALPQARATCSRPIRASPTSAPARDTSTPCMPWCRTRSDAARPPTCRRCWPATQYGHDHPHSLTPPRTEQENP